MRQDRLKYWLRNPNTLTLGRLVASPLIVLLMMFPSPLCTFLAGLLFAAAAVTDFFDGFLARSRGMVSNFGKIMDPLADKVLASSAFIMLASLGWLPAWMVCIIIGRELAVTGLRNFVVEDGQDVSSSSLGKYKTGFQIAAIIPLLVHYNHLGIDFHAIGNVFVWVALVLTVWSGADYLLRYRELLKF